MSKLKFSQGALRRAEKFLKNPKALDQNGKTYMLSLYEQSKKLMSDLCLFHRAYVDSSSESIMRLVRKNREVNK